MKELIDINNYFICIYNDNQVGLFYKTDYLTNCSASRKTNRHLYDAGSIFKGIDSDYTGLRSTHEKGYSTNEWQPIGYYGAHEITCHMRKSISFDEVRLIMCIQGKIEPYQPGMATKKDIIDVLTFAQEYYQHTLKQCTRVR